MWRNAERLTIQQRSQQSQNNPVAMYRRLCKSWVLLLKTPIVLISSSFQLGHTLTGGERTLCIAAEATIRNAMNSCLVSTAKDRSTLFRLISDARLGARFTVNKPFTGSAMAIVGIYRVTNVFLAILHRYMTSWNSQIRLKEIGFIILLFLIPK